ncbi:lipid II:glycine glycyltransferase FemX [Aestuariimicrobium sp. T2.26MG-19.2B]|uniref:lipid II:glycine glycyltransferase FemX n=1 Tax=Aestuariimicrobium sp. T2.26MG-19.2B TaxID=3040679 RepID=UPI002477C7EC|nr:UDP-N-acetylmuramoylpentapeptide-lysine N(6)-alanyltransferase [Aestuariimicrobium sp. T2.26MG-19.2B]
MSIHLRRITPDEHLGFIREVSAPGSTFPTTVSFLQTPAWAKVKPEWTSESLGWFEGTELIGVGLVLYRLLPHVSRLGLRSSLAYLPEGPVLDWTRPDVPELLTALAKHARERGAFGLRIGPTLPHQSWGPETIKTAIADPAITRLSQATADHTDHAATRLANQLRSLGWKAPKDGEGFQAGQPKFNFQLPLTVVDEESGERRQKTPDELLKGMNQLWRRNIKKADKSGVEVTRGTRDDLAAFHTAYLETAARDGFTGRPLSYFQTMWDALTDEDPDRMRVYLARHEGELVAATTWVGVGRHCWYSYGASTNAKREVRGSNAIQWQMIQDSLAAGGEVYDLRGITEGVAEDDPEIGLIQFKVGTGGQAVSYVGEWDLPLIWPVHRAFTLYMERRAGKKPTA